MSLGNDDEPQHDQPRLSGFVAGATLAVFVVWVSFVLLAVPEERGSWADAIGSLFSGLAFVGVVAAIFLQREELSLQRQELKDMRAELRRSAEANEEHALQMARQVGELETESKNNELGRIRQRREQFLTSRLNATVALLQACQASMEALDDNDVFRRADAAIEINKLKQELAILRCEARLPISAETWDKSVEARAIHAYLTEIFHGLSDRTGRLDDGRLVVPRSEASLAASKVRSLLARIRHTQPAIASALTPLCLMQLKTDDDARLWITGFLTNTLSETDPIWRTRRSVNQKKSEATATAQ
jgi:hypothetical protein